MNMRRLMRRSTRQYIIVAIICILVIGGAAAAATLLSVNMFRLKYEAKLSAAVKELDKNKRLVYKAITDIKTGDTISLDNVVMEEVYSSQPAESFMGAFEIGKAAVIDIPEGTLVVKSMLSNKDISSGLRELEYNTINISSNITCNDVVDVRILYPNGESFIVLSKKTIFNLTPETSTCCFWLSEEEILRMSAAIVDAGLYTGSGLMVTKYIEPTMQEASIITYTPSLHILSLIEEDPNIIGRCSQELARKVRKALENRLAKSMELDVTEIYWEDAGSVKETSHPVPEEPGPGDDSRDETDAANNPSFAPAPVPEESDYGSIEDGYMIFTDEAGGEDMEFGE
jgi:hypothetical protein